MSLVLYNNGARLRPWSPFANFERDFGRWLDEPVTRSGEWAPAFDIEENEDAYAVTADLPGMRKEDISITAHDNVVTIKGERKREEEKEERGYRRFERAHGAFERSFTVRDGFDADNISAQYRDGVLTVTLPKLAERKARQIEVQAN